MESQKALPFYHGFMVVNYYLLSNVNLKTTTTLSLISYIQIKFNHRYSRKCTRTVSMYSICLS